jgi:hypothetical protein
MSVTAESRLNALALSGVTIPDSTLVRQATELVRDTESELLFNHSTRVYCFGTLAGNRRGLKFDSELLYIGAMFHDMGLTPRYSSKADRFEVDGANCAREFLRRYGISEQEVETVWAAIALHTTPGVTQCMHPVIALVTAGVEMDVVGIGYAEVSENDRQVVVHAFPRSPHFKEEIIEAFYNGMKHKPHTTFGTMNADVLADKDPHFQRTNMCTLIRASAWQS